MGNMKNVLIKAAAVPAAAAFLFAGTGIAAANPIDIDTTAHADGVAEVQANIADVQANIADAKADAQANIAAKVDDIKDGIKDKTDGIVDARAAIADKVEDTKDAAADAVADARANVAATVDKATDFDGVGGLHLGGALGGAAHGGLVVDLNGGLLLGGLFGIAIHGLEHGHHDAAPCKPVHVVTKAKANDTTVVYTSASKTLPQTGVPAAALAGAGIATIAAGAGVTFLARRREA